MEAKLSAIRENDKTLLDDAGINALYAAFGVVEWYESTDSNIALFAPVVFVPVEIGRALENGVYKFTLAARDDDIEINQAFAELIKETHSLQLPAWNPEGTLAQYLDEVEALVAKHRRWRVRRWVTVGLFTFAKMAMYRDLDTRRWFEWGGLETHSILRDLLAGAESVSQVSLAPDYEIDSAAQAGKKQTLITDADSSQHSALIDVFEGKNLVIQGPPGTGKSQTITNIIAAALSEGKRVLFVAEKMAALKVVKDRLDSFGLGNFCLELHSNKTRKAVVLKSFEDRLKMAAANFDTRKLQQLLQSHEQARSELLYFVGKMKEEVGQTGLTIQDILRANSTRTSMGESLASSLRKERVVQPTLESADARLELKGLAKELEANAAAVNKWGKLTKHPWRGVENANLDFFQADELCAELANWHYALGLLQQTIVDLNDLVGWGLKDTQDAALEFGIGVVLMHDTPPEPSDFVLQILSSQSGVKFLQELSRDLEQAVSASECLLPQFLGADALEQIQVADLRRALVAVRELQVHDLTLGDLEELWHQQQQAGIQSKRIPSTAK